MQDVSERGTEGAAIRKRSHPPAVMTSSAKMLSLDNDITPTLGSWANVTTKKKAARITTLSMAEFAC